MFILLYYVLSSIRLYLCFVLWIYIYITIFIYISLSIYWFISFICIFFILFIHMLYCIVFYLFITYIIIYRERDHIPLQRSNPTSSCLAASGCGVILGPPKPPLGDSASAEWDSAAGPPNGNCPSKGWCRIKNDGISMEYIYIYIHLSIHPSIYVCMHACMYVYIYMCVCIYWYWYNLVN